MTHQIIRTAALVLATLLAVAPLRAEIIDPGEIIQAEILPGWRTANGTLMAALHLRLAPGWKTYWRAPGEAGIPPLFNIDASTNIAGMQAHWPRPQVFDLGGMQSFGFHGELVLPLEITPKGAGPLALVAEIQLGVCKDICVPVTVNLAATLAADPAGSARNPAILAALASQPRPGRQAGLTGAHCAVAPIADGMHLTVLLDLPALGGLEVGVIETADPGIWVSPATTRRQGGQLSIAADLVAPDNAPFALDRSTLRITVLGTNSAVDIKGCEAG